jgi:hypothetical protein
VSGAVVGRHEPKLLPGGLLAVRGARFRLRPPVLGSAWRLRGTRGHWSTVLLADPKPGGEFAVYVKPAASALDDLGLVVMLALAAIQIEVVADAGLGGGAAAPIGP